MYQSYILRPGRCTTLSADEGPAGAVIRQDLGDPRHLRYTPLGYSGEMDATAPDSHSAAAVEALIRQPCANLGRNDQRKRLCESKQLCVSGLSRLVSYSFEEFFGGLVG